MITLLSTNWAITVLGTNWAGCRIWPCSRSLPDSCCGWSVIDNRTPTGSPWHHAIKCTQCVI